MVSAWPGAGLVCCGAGSGPSGCRASNLVSVFELVEADRARLRGQRQVPVGEDHEVVGHLLGPLDVLLDDEKRGRAPELSHDGEQFVHDGRGEPVRQLVGDDESGLLDQDAAQGQHLLLAAGQHPGPVLRPGSEEGKDGRRLVHRFLPGPAGQAGTADDDVLGHGERGEDGALLGNVGDAAPRPAEVRLTADVGVAEQHRSGAGRDGPGHARGQGRLARAVRAEDGADAAGRHVERDVAQRLQSAVGVAEATYRQRRAADGFRRGRGDHLRAAHCSSPPK